MALLPEIKAILDAIPPERSLDVSALPLDEALRRLRNRPPLPVQIERPVAIENRTIPGPAGEMEIRIYRPENAGPRGILVHFHGGGWVLGTLDQDDLHCHWLARDAGCIVVSVDYRLAPEHPFPQPLDDCFAATQWVARHAAELGGDPDRIALGGLSAGGNLAAAVALRARDSGFPRLAFQLLFYPICDAALDFPSCTENATGYYLTLADMVWFWNCYAPDPADRDNPYASPLRAPSLAGLPPAMILTAEHDPLRDEAKAYAQRLQAAGVAVTYRQADGVVHGFLKMAPRAPWVREPMEQAVTALRAALEAR